MSRTIVENGKIGDIQYWICENRMMNEQVRGYWTVYVDTLNLTTLGGKPLLCEEDINTVLNVHEGCTYFGQPFFLKDPQGITVAGWDYMHGCDVDFNILALSSKQTLEEVRADVVSALAGF